MLGLDRCLLFAAAGGEETGDTVADAAESALGFDWAAMMPQIVSYGTSAAGALLLLFVAWIAARIIGSMVATGLRKASFDETLTRFFAKAVRWLVLVIALLMCLSIFGIETTSFAAVLAAGGFAVGLAFQGTLGNFAAGIMLLVFRPYKVGDVVNVAGQVGKVNEIELFTTTLDTFDNRRIIIPNGTIFGSVIENITHHPQRRADVEVGVDYSADIQKTREVLEAAVKSVEGVLQDPAPAVMLTGLGGSSVDWVVRAWANTGDFGSVKERTTVAVKEALDAAGIGIPYPTMDVNVNQSAG
jgi:small conductance mechanosensitive channel